MSNLALMHLFHTRKPVYLQRCMCIWLLVTAFSVATAATSTVHTITVPTAGISNAPAALQGVLFAPTSTPNGAGVVMLHGCGGAYSQNGNLNARHQMWGDYLARLGYQVLMLDSLTARGLRQLCTIPMQQRSIKEADRVGDAYAGLQFLAQQPGIDPQKIALLGWSHGGGVVLSAIGQAASAAPVQARPISKEQDDAPNPQPIANDKAAPGRFKAAVSGIRRHHIAHFKNSLFILVHFSVAPDFM